MPKLINAPQWFSDKPGYQFIIMKDGTITSCEVYGWRIRKGETRILHAEDGVTNDNQLPDRPVLYYAVRPEYSSTEPPRFDYFEVGSPLTYLQKR